VGSWAGSVVAVCVGSVLVPTIGSYVVIGLVAAAVTFAVTPLVGMFARRMGWVYLPNDRTVHETPLPDIGGLAMYIGFVAAYVTASLTGSLDVVFRSNSEPRGVFVAVTIIYAVGLIDDVREISAPAKVFGIVLAGIALVQFGVVMFAFRLPFYDGSIFLDESLRPLITILWLLGMSTVVNLVDGLDGLAAGIVGIGAISFFLYSERLTDLDLLDSANVGPLFAVIAAGLCVGFLPHNFNPARIFMGDGGALLLGLLLAVSTSVVGGRVDSVEQETIGTTYFFLAPLVIPLLILGVPIFDTLFAIVRRATSGKGLASADKGHLHHRLMEMGHGHRRSVVILWLWSAVLSGFVLYPTLADQNPTYLPFGIAVIGIVLYTVLHPSVRARRKENSIPSQGIARKPVDMTSDMTSEMTSEMTSDTQAESERRELPGQLELDVTGENLRTQLPSAGRDA
jgi:UDP-GlcNAc:undecaprenyl-phosphate GlcNAc-1-phosphate transferase